MKHRIIIIGSGLGGLACGRLLSKAGYDVVVLEQGRQPGGCLQSYRRGGFSFDTGMHYVGSLLPGESLHTAFQMLGLDDLPWQQLDSDGFDRICLDGEEYPLVNGFDRFAEQLSDRFPQDRAALRQLAEDLRKTETGLVERVMDCSIVGDKTIGQMSVNAYDTLSERLHDPRLLQVLGGSAMKMELRHDSFSWFAFLHSLSGYVPSAWRLRGDSGSIVRRLIDGIRRSGGEVACGKRVERLTERDGRLVEAVCSDGSTYEGDIFISDIHPAQTFALVQDSHVLRPIFKRRLQRLTNTTGMFTVSLVLKDGAIPYRNYNQYVYAPGTDVWRLTENNDPERGVIVSYRVPDNYMGMRGAQVSARQIDLLTPMSWQECSRWADLPVGHRGEDYLAWKQQKAEETVALAQTRVPGLRDAIEYCHTSTPLTWHNYTLAPDGSAFGIRKDNRSALMTMFSVMTPLANLYLTGQNVLLHGIEGVTMTALGTVEKIKKVKE